MTEPQATRIIPPAAASPHTEEMTPDMPVLGILRALTGVALPIAVILIMLHAGQSETYGDTDLQRIQLWVQAGAQSVVAIGIALGVCIFTWAFDKD